MIAWIYNTDLTCARMSVDAVDWRTDICVPESGANDVTTASAGHAVTQPAIWLNLSVCSNVKNLPVSGAHITVMKTFAKKKYDATEIYDGCSCQLSSKTDMVDIENKHCGVWVGFEFPGWKSEMEINNKIPAMPKHVLLGSVFISAKDWYHPEQSWTTNVSLNKSRAKTYTSTARIENSGIQMTLTMTKLKSKPYPSSDAIVQALQAQQIDVNAAAEFWNKCAGVRQAAKASLLSPDARQVFTNMPFQMPCARSFLQQNDESQIRLMMQSLVKANPDRYMHHFLPTVMKMIQGSPNINAKTT